MFSAQLTNLQSELTTIKNVAQVQEHAIQLFFQPHDPDLWSAVRPLSPNVVGWRIYNHCGALTRLYAAYSAFVEQLTREFLLKMPDFYDKYAELPAALMKQHRIGLSQILAKLSETGPYGHLSEYEIVAELSRGLAGERPFKLLPEAFFVDRQNYRLEALARMLGYLGIENAENRIARHPDIRSFLTRNLGESATLRAELKRFVDLRNEAAHDQVENTIGLPDFQLIADLVEVVCLALVDIMSHEIVRRCHVVGKLETIGEVIYVYRSGTIPIVKMKSVCLKVEDELVILRADRVTKLAKIVSIQVDGIDFPEISADDGQELGVRVNAKCNIGDILAKAPAEKVESERQPESLREEMPSQVSSGQSSIEDTDEPEDEVSDEAEPENANE
jgi:hypothetical protein